MRPKLGLMVTFETIYKHTVFTLVTCSILGRETQVYPCLVAKAKLLEKSRFEVNTQVSCSWQRNATLPCQVMIAKQ